MPTTAPIKVPIIGQDKFTKEFNKLTNKLKLTGQTISGVGKTLTTAVSLPLVGLGAISLRSSRELNKAMANVGTLIPGQTAKLEKYKKGVMDLAVETGTASTELSQGLYETISAFGDSKESMDQLTIAAKMGKAGLASTSEALGLLSAVSKGYNDTTAQSLQQISDMSFLTVKLGQTNFPDLANAIGRVVPFAASLNVPMKELYGSISTLSGVTGNAAEVSTQLKAVFGAFITPSEDMKKAVKKLHKEHKDLNFTNTESMVKNLGLAKSLQLLNDYTKGDLEKLGKLIPAKEALSAVLSLLGPQSANFAKNTNLMSEAEGESARALKEQTKGIDKAGFKWDQMVQRLNNLTTKIGDRLVPILEKVLNKLEPFINKMLAASDESIEFGIKIAGAAILVGPFLLAVGKTIVAVSTLRKILGPTGLQSTLKGLSSPLIGAKKGLADLSTAAPASLGGKGTGAMAKLSAVGGVASAGLMGVGVGMALNEAVFEPQNKAYGDMVDKALGSTAKNVQSVEQIKKALANTQIQKMELAKNFVNTENLFGTIASIFTDTQSPNARLQEAMIALNKTQDDLRAKLVNEMRTAGVTSFEAVNKKIVVDSKASADINIKFENVPENVKPVVNRKNGNVNVRNKGAIMSGNI